MSSPNYAANDPERDELLKQLEEIVNSGQGTKILRFLLAAAGGAIPLLGGFVSGAGNAWGETEQGKANKVFAAWLKLQADEIREIGTTIGEILIRLDLDDPLIAERVESQEYLVLVKKAFREWSAAESEDKRKLIRNLLVNAAATRLCADDVIRLFMRWIDDYTEAHFTVIKAVYNHDGISRGEVWEAIHGGSVREDSADADLFKLLFRDLSTGGIIRQHREKDADGNFLKQRQGGRHGRSPVMTSAFDDDKDYELTELGKQFVHYTMNEIVPRIAEHADSSSTVDNAT